MGCGASAKIGPRGTPAAGAGSAASGGEAANAPVLAAIEGSCSASTPAASVSASSAAAQASTPAPAAVPASVASVEASPAPAEAAPVAEAVPADAPPSTTLLFASSGSVAGAPDLAQLDKLASDMSPEQVAQVMQAIVQLPQAPHVARKVLREKHAGVRDVLRNYQRSAVAVKSWKEAVAPKATAAGTLHEEHVQLLAAAKAEYAQPVLGFGPGDCLLVVDMQNDFLPAADAPDGGRFAISEGADASAVIVEMMAKAAAARALIVATRDYHPLGHCSFATNSGPFPVHCVQGSKGALFFPPVARALNEAKASGADTRVVFKGFHEAVDSFGGLRYGERYFGERGLGHGTSVSPNDMSHGCCMLDWTGAFCLECSDIDADINAPPDVLAVLKRRALQDELVASGVRRLFVTGLALDVVVLDSALNAADAGLAPDGVFLVADATRAVHLPGVGTFGSGFVSDPEEIVSKMALQGVRLINSKDIGG